MCHHRLVHRLIAGRHTTSYRPAPVLSAEQQEELRAAFAQAAVRDQHWTGTDVATWMSRHLGRPVSYELGWTYLVKLKHSQQRPRPQHALADPEEQETFKKQLQPLLRAVAMAFPHAKVRLEDAESERGGPSTAARR
jgi:Winged helix-turn helix